MKYIFTLLGISLMYTSTAQDKFYPKLAEYCSEAVEEFDQVSDERKVLLDDMASYILETKENGGPVVLTFICTHNSRRSHMAQLWASAAATYYGIDDVLCYSGGTEATAFNMSAIKSLERAGFRITKVQASQNPLYEARLSNRSKPLKMWSKKYDDPLNPSENFAAVMVCSDADKNCPFVPGASTRIAIPYDDPKAFDGTPSESAMYDERCRQISREMLFVLRQVKEQEIRNSN